MYQVFHSALKVSIIILLWTCLLNTSHAQQFQWITQGNGTDYSSGKFAGTDTLGNSYILSKFREIFTLGDSIYIAPNHTYDAFVAKYDANGKLTWTRSIIGLTNEDINGFQVDKAGNCVIAGSYSGGLTVIDTTLRAVISPGIFITKLNDKGSRIWPLQIITGGKIWLKSILMDKDNNVYISGSFENSIYYNGFTLYTTSVNGSSFLAKYDKQGNFQWLDLIGDSQAGGNMSLDTNGNLYIAGTFENSVFIGNQVLQAKNAASSSLNTDGFISKYSSAGKLLWVKQISSTKMIRITSISVDGSGSSYVTGRIRGQLTIGRSTMAGVVSDGVSDVFAAMFDPVGNGVWGVRAGSDNESAEGSIVADAYGSVYFSGSTIGVSGKIGSKNLMKGLFLARLDKLGNIKWVKQPVGEHIGFCYLSKGVNETLSITGSLIGGNIDFDGKLLTTAGPYENFFAAGLSETRAAVQLNTITGNIFTKSTAPASCEKEAADLPMEGMVVKAEPGPYYGSADKAGNYTLHLPKGTYTISQLLPAASKEKHINQVCPAPAENYTITLENDQGQTIENLNFANTVLYKPYLTIDVASDRRRRCFRNITTVTYRNEGYAAVNHVQVKVIVPQYVVPISSSQAWSSKKDSVLTFDIGTLAAGASGTITLTDSVVCGNESIRGLTLCTKAIITPFNTHEEVDSRWDGSTVNLSGWCRDNGYVRLSLKNTGSHAMADSAAYRILINAVEVFSAKYKLAKGDSLLLEVPANGRTVRLEADLPAYHPGKGKPSITIEGCGGNNRVIVSKGYVDRLSQDDADEEIEISCLPILDSYDPNDKQVSPAGALASGLITKDTQLEYTIRFQNTGSDVAYTVVIEDVLNEHLDLATLQIGAASHPFTWQISGEKAPKIIWRFNNINLPDSTTNEPASHGFVRFKIAQKPGNAKGMIITNQADIYFDYNSAIVTNQTVNTIGDLPMATERLEVDFCQSQSPSLAQAGDDIRIHEIATTQLAAVVPQQGHGRWRVLQGGGYIADPASVSAVVTDLPVGKTLLEWAVRLCDQETKDTIVVERVAIPTMPQILTPTIYCVGDVLPSIVVIGNNVEWFADKDLTKKLAEGNSYQPQITQTTTFFVTQTENGYQSLANEIVIDIRNRPGSPKVAPLAYHCKNVLLSPLEAEGENISWYSDIALTKKLAEGNTFAKQSIAIAVLYVTQRINGCESKPAKVLLKPGGLDYDRVYVANVITPNGDYKNDTFTGPQFPEGSCIGNFEGIQIYNRWGKLIYESRDMNFVWGASDLSNGVYFYSMHYSNFSYRGSITVLR